MSEDVTMGAPEDLLVSRRSRRSTAGNRMEAALAEMALDTTEKDMEDDIDFINDKDEEDVFESDFESTDEEAEKEDVEAGDKVLQDEERRAKKAARSKLDKVTAAAHAKHKATFNPHAEAASKPKELQRRVSLGVAVNAETGEVAALGKGSPAKKKRHSQRKFTILSTSAHVKRMKRSEEKKAAAPKKVRSESRSYTQAELIAGALDNEEGNLVEHRDYLKIEEEKRKRARVVRATVEGPLLRWVSKGEEVKVLPPPLPPPVPVFSNYSRPAGAYYYAPYTTASGSTSYGQGSGAYPYAMGPQAMQVPAGTYPGASNYMPTVPTNAAPSTSTSTPSVSRSATPTSTAAPSTGMTVASTSLLASTSQTQPAPSSSMRRPQQSQSQSQLLFQPTNYIPYSPQVTEAIASSTGTILPLPASPEPQPIERTEKVAKNYVVHELSQYEGVPKPPWTETMVAMFGDHVKWDEVKVYVGKSRPLSRPKQICPITGKVGRYLDPRTGVPYADVRAYKVLSGVLRHEFVWSPGLRCYIGKEEAAEAMAA